MERETWKSQTPTTSVEQQTSNTKAGKKRMPSEYRPGGSVKVRWPHSKSSSSSPLTFPQESYPGLIWHSPPEPAVLFSKPLFSSIPHPLPPNHGPSVLIVLSFQKAKRIMQVKRCRQENVSRSRFLKGLIPSIKSKKAREPALTTCHLNETRTENQTEPKKNQETVKKPTISGDDQGRQNLGMVAETTEIPAESLKSSSWEMASYTHGYEKNKNLLLKICVCLCKLSHGREGRRGEAGVWDRQRWGSVRLGIGPEGLQLARNWGEVWALKTNFFTLSPRQEAMSWGFCMGLRGVGQ